MLFKIISISYGWFEVDFNRQWILTNSCYLSCDAPALLLDALCNLLEDKVDKEWLCWQDEPGANILKLDKTDEQLSIEIYATDKDSCDLAHSGVTLSKHVTECLYKTKEDLKKCAEAIYMEFELYEYGIGRKRYEKNWGTFPPQYFRLRELLKQKNTSYPGFYVGSNR